MWSVKYLPKPGSARIASRSLSVAGLAARETVNSGESLVMGPILYPRANGFLPSERALTRFHGDERRAHDLAFGGAAAHVDGDLLTVIDSRVGVDQRQSDADLQCRRECPGRGEPDRALP